jgi:UDP-galactopyranose mutase
MDFAGLEFLVVGAGLSGLTVAERLSAAGRKVAVIERRSELGGLAAAYVDQETGIEVHRHGTHVFHTDEMRVADYLLRFCALDGYRHRVVARAKRRCYPWPINLMTINSFYSLDMTPRQAAGFLRVMAATYSPGPPELLRPPDGVRVLLPPCAPSDASGRKRLRERPAPANFREACIDRMGLQLYEAFIEGYSRKQWGRDPSELPAELATRVPVRTGYACDLFEDAWQGLPFDGWPSVFSRMRAGVPVHLGLDFFDIRESLPAGVRVVYTGPLDAWFGQRFGELPWRGVSFETDTHAVGDYQGAAVINHCDERQACTRTHEFRHLRPGGRCSRRKTVVSVEHAGAGGEPAYPVEPDGELAQRYRQAAAAEPGVHFLGRLGTYRYLNMDQAIGQALGLAEVLCRPN